MRTTVFFATNRRLTGSGELPSHYAGEEGPPGDPGRLIHATAFVEGIDVATQNTGRIASIQEVSPGVFDADVAADLAGGRNLLIFLHGFANGFSDAITRAAFNREFLAASGLPAADCSVVAFSWPSRGRVIDPTSVVPGIALLPLSLMLLAAGRVASPLAFAYVQDQRGGEAAATDLISVLDRMRPVMRQVRARGGRVFLLAHSMGNFLLQTALDQWAKRGLPDEVLFDEAFSVSADTGWSEKTGASLEYLQTLAKLSRRVQVHHSPEDGILELSTKVNGLRRLGEAGPKDILDAIRYPGPKFRFVDCSVFPDTGPGRSVDTSHQFYRRVPAVRDDIAKAMAGLV
jgi:esterase/lipase superfamily enzyme